MRDAAGKLIKVDDPRFDPMWEACAALGIPVAIHVSDPAAFFTRPIAGGLAAVTLLILLWPIGASLWRRLRARADA